MRFLFVIITSMVLGACTFMHQDFANYGKNYNKINLHMLSIGNDKQQVVSALGDPTNVIGAKPFEKGVVEVWAYERWNAQIGLDHRQRNTGCTS